jgi:hypothetical protein
MALEASSGRQRLALSSSLRLDANKARFSCTQARFDNGGARFDNEKSLFGVELSTDAHYKKPCDP